MKHAWIWGVAPLLALLALPFALRPAPEERPAPEGSDRLVIYSPHPESVRREIDGAFRRYYRRQHGRDIVLDFRSPGGTSDIVRYIDDRFTAAFRREWEAAGHVWSDEIADAFRNPRLPENASDEAKEARRMFLAGSTSIDGDLFWGGGTFDHARQAEKGYAVDARIRELHPEYFDPAIIAPELSGDRIYDPEGRYYGVCLASFGICYNRDRIAELPDGNAPRRWADLAGPEYFGLVAVADPTKSGSIAKCFELIVQQAIGEALARGGDMETGWADGLNRIKRLVANAGVVTESASLVTNQVARGEAAVGMAIDFYAMNAAEWQSLQGANPPPLAYAVPERGSSVSADPIQLLRGAPDEAAAREFIAYLLSEEGQKLFDYRVGTPGGPERTALRRAPVRRDFYREPHLQYRSDPDYNPYRDAGEVIYHPEWTSPYFNLLRVVIRCTLLDVQEELSAAWRAIIDAGGPEAVPEAYEMFCRVPFAYAQASEMNGKLRQSEHWSAEDIAGLRREWAVKARDQYLAAAKLAREGR